MDLRYLTLEIQKFLGLTWNSELEILSLRKNCCHFYTLQNGQYYKWKTLTIGHIKFIATTVFTLKLIFIWSWFETLLLIICAVFTLIFFCVKPYITFNTFWIRLKIDNWFRMRFNFHSYTLILMILETKKNQRTQWKMAIYSRSSVQNFDNWWFWIRKSNALLNLIN